MKTENSDDFQIKTKGRDDLDTSIAFVQVPARIKDRVRTFIDDNANEDEKAKMAIGNDPAPFQNSGCFFVISLEKIEKIHGMLRNALDYKLEDPDKIRDFVNQALTALQGQ